MSDQNQLLDSMYGVFSQKAEDVKIKEEASEGGNVMFKPNPQDSQDNVWRGIIKLIPRLESPTEPIVKKTSYWITDPTSNKGFSFDSPKSLGKYEDCPVASKYWEWKNSDDARLQEAAEKLQYNRNSYTLVQILKDAQNEENNGKILVWKLPRKVEKMITDKMFPSKEDMDMGEEQHNPYNPFDGLPLVLKIGEKSTEKGTFRDWDGISWGKKPTTMILEGEKAILTADGTKEQQDKALETMLNGPKLSDFSYSPANEAELTKLKNVLAVIEGSPVNTEAPNTTTQKTETVQDSPKEDDKAVKTETVQDSTQNETATLKTDKVADNIIDELDL